MLQGAHCLQQVPTGPVCAYVWLSVTVVAAQYITIAQLCTVTHHMSHDRPKPKCADADMPTATTTLLLLAASTAIVLLFH